MYVSLDIADIYYQYLIRTYLLQFSNTNLIKYHKKI